MTSPVYPFNDAGRRARYLSIFSGCGSTIKSINTVSYKFPECDCDPGNSGRTVAWCLCGQPIPSLTLLLRYGIKPSDIDAGAAVITKAEARSVMKLKELNYR